MSFNFGTSRDRGPCGAVLALVLGGLALNPGTALAHEAWLLTPDEMAALAVAPVPAVFTDFWPLAGFVLAMAVGALAALVVADRLRAVERRVFRPFAVRATHLGPFLVRLGLGVMLGLAAVGGLPRNGTALWTTPTLMVPDMQLVLAGDGWDWLAYAELIVALALLAGFAVRAAALGVILLVAIGLWVFGTPFLAYGPHFAAPALILLVYGGGVLALDDQLWPTHRRLLSGPRALPAWRGVMALLGGTFVYLGIVYKLQQPTLLIAILQHGELPTFGLPIEIIALVMMLVEVTAGALLALGLLVRPVALFMIGAFTFFVFTLGETPLFHANLYGAMAMLLMAGAAAPRPVRPMALKPLILRSVSR